MVGKISAALVAALLLASAGIASARPAWDATSYRVFAPSVEYRRADLPAQRGAVLLLAQLAVRQRAPRDELIIPPPPGGDSRGAQYRLVPGCRP